MSILVNNQLVDDQLIRDEARLLRDRLKHDEPDADPLQLELTAREHARENVITRVILQQLAGNGSPDELLRGVMAHVPPPNSLDVKSHYKKFSDRFYRPETIRAAHIVKNVDESATEGEAETTIRQIADQLKAGADFSVVADLCSDCPGQGGDLGFFARGEMVPEFDDAVFALKLGEISDIFRTSFGFHIAKLSERRKPGLPSFSEVREKVEADLWSRRKMMVADEFIRTVRARAEIRKA